VRELVTMWRHTKMVVLVALTAAVYAAILIPFKGIPLIPGITEVRPANVVPVVFSLLFGPAAAWGSAIGNLIGDLLVPWGRAASSGSSVTSSSAWFPTLSGDTWVPCPREWSRTCVRAGGGRCWNSPWWRSWPAPFAP